MNLKELAEIATRAAANHPTAPVIIEDLRTGFAEDASNAYLSHDGYFYVQRGEEEEEDDEDD